MDTNSVFAALKARFGEAVRELVTASPDPAIVVDKAKLHEICQALATERDFSFDYLASVSGLDLTDRFFIVYHLVSLRYRVRLVLKVEVPANDTTIDTVSDIWPAANWHEREQYDLFGFTFRGHPDMRRILLPEDWVGHPLRKDYMFPDSYHGISAHRPNPLEQLAAKDAREHPVAAPPPPPVPTTTPTPTPKPS